MVFWWATALALLVFLVGWIGAGRHAAGMHRHAPAAFQEADTHLAQGRWRDAARVLLTVLPYSGEPRDVPLLRQVLVRAVRLDRMRWDPALTDVDGRLRQQLDRVESHGGKVDVDATAPLERFLRGTATGQLDGAFAAVSEAPSLHQAVFRRDVHAVKDLLGAAADVGALDAPGKTAAQRALETEQLAVVCLLLRAGATLDAAQLPALFQMVTLGVPPAPLEDHIWLAHWLLDRGWDPSGLNHFTGQTLLDWARSVGARDLTKRLKASS